MNAKEIEGYLRERAEEVARHLLPRGKVIGNNWITGDLDGEKGDATKVCIKGDRIGVWKDFSKGPEDSGNSLIKLWARVNRLKWNEALKEIEEFYNLQSVKVDFKGPKKKDYARPPRPINAKSLSAAPRAIKYLTETRKISKDSLDAFKVSSNDKDEILFPFLKDGELMNIKYLKIDRDAKGKKVIRQEANTEPCLFGWQALSGDEDRILLSEGEADCVSWRDYGYAALSIPGGVSDMRWIEYEFEALEQFSEILICMDMDDAGREATVSILDRLGRDRCRVISLPMKDINECLMAGVSKDIIDECVRNAKSEDPQELRGARSFENEIMEYFASGPLLSGNTLPYPKTHERFRMNNGELILLAGNDGAGKSAHIEQYVVDSAVLQGERTCIASLEMAPAKFLYDCIRIATARLDPSKMWIDKVMDVFDDKIWIFNVTGEAKTEKMLEVFAYAKKRYGVNQFVIDNLMMLDIAEDDYQAQSVFMKKIRDFKEKYHCKIFLVAHTSKPIDEYQKPDKNRIKGSGAIKAMADSILLVWRNMRKEELRDRNPETLDDKERKVLDGPDSVISCAKFRHSKEGALFSVALKFDGKSKQFYDFSQRGPRVYVPFDEKDMLERNNGKSIWEG